MEPQKSNSDQLRELFKSFEKKYLEDLMNNLEPVKINNAYNIIRDPNFNKTIFEVKYNFSKN